MNLKIPNYEVVIHICHNNFSSSLQSEINNLSKEFMLDELTEHAGVIDYHWSFSSWTAAINAGEKLKRLIDNPNLILLKVKANYDATLESVVHKDNRSNINVKK